MTAAAAAVTELGALIYRVLDTVEVLDCSVCSGDLLVARYAAATLAELADTIETALLTLDRAGRAARVAVAT